MPIGPRGANASVFDEGIGRIQAGSPSGVTPVHTHAV